MKWLTLLFIVIMAGIVVAADKGRLPPFITALYAFPNGDKAGHFVLFGILAFLLNMSLPMLPAPRPWLSLVAGSLLLAVAVAVEEASQSLFSTRTASWADLASSYAGIACFACLAGVVRLARRPDWTSAID